MIRPTLAACALLLAAGPPLQAQFTEGQRVRVEAPSEGVYSPSAGTVMQVLPDSVVIDIRGVQHTLSHRGITRLQVSRGKMLDVESTLVNVCLGAAAGYAAGWIHYYVGSDGEAGEAQRSRRRDMRPALASAGALAGGTIFTFRPGDRWQTVPVEVAAAADPRTGSARLAFTLRF